METQEIRQQDIATIIEARNSAKRALEPPYQRRVKPRLTYRCRQAFGIVNPRIIMDQLDEPTPEFHSMIQKVLNEGSLTQDDAESLQEADFVISAENNHHVVVETSVTLEDRDIRRAAERAAILSQITQGTVRAAVAAEEIDPGHRKLAEELNVTIFRVEL